MNRNQKDIKSAKQPRARPTIGFITTNLSSKNTSSIWQGVVDAAQERQVNLISYVARDLKTTNGFDAQANIFYDLINTDLLDGLVIWTTTFVSYAGRAVAAQILKRYHPLPIVAIESGAPDNIPRLDIGSYPLMREVMFHLVKHHGYRRIAFIRGPEGHSAARERYQAYQDVLAECGLPFDPDLVSPASGGSWEQIVGEQAVALLLDQRQVNFEAIVGANDNFAIGAMRALEARDIHIPNQVAVAGFDDDSGSDSLIPPLTTIAMQGYEYGQRAVEMLLTLLASGEPPEQSPILPKLIIRQSCGCINPAVGQAAANAVMLQDKPFTRLTAANKKTSLAEIRQATGFNIKDLASDWTERLLETFWADLTADQPVEFLPTLEMMLRRVIASRGPVSAWENVISALRRSLLPYLGEEQAGLRAADLCLQAQVLISETAQMASRNQALREQQQAQILDEIKLALITTFDVDALLDTLVQQLPRLGMPGFYLSLYEQPQQPTETARLLVAYDEQRGRLELPAEKQLFSSRYLVPKGLLPQERPCSLVAEALYFREEQLGYIVFEVGPRQGQIYDGMRGVISSALQGALLVQRVQEVVVVCMALAVACAILDNPLVQVDRMFPIPVCVALVMRL